MKILLLGSKEYPFQASKGFDKFPGGGYEVFVEKLAKYIERNGHEPVIVTRKFPNQKDYEKIGNISVYRVPYIENIRLRTFSFNYNSYKKTKEIFEKEKIDLIHGNGAIAGYFSQKLARKFKKPFVFTPHGKTTGWPFPIQQILEVMEDIAVKRTDYLIFISKLGKNEWTKKYPKKEFKLLSNCLDLDDFNPQAKRDWEEPRFGFLGRLEEVKGIYFLAEAFNKVVKQLHDAKLIVGGTGRDMNKMKEILEKENSLKNVEFRGWIDSWNVPKFLEEIDFFVLPSWERGHPIALLESMAMKNIIISSLDYIHDNENGIKVKKKDANDLAEKMISSAKSIDSLNKLRENARKEVEAITWEQMVHEYLEVYNLFK